MCANNRITIFSKARQVRAFSFGDLNAEHSSLSGGKCDSERHLGWRLGIGADRPLPDHQYAYACRERAFVPLGSGCIVLLRPRIE